MVRAANGDGNDKNEGRKMMNSRSNAFRRIALASVIVFGAASLPVGPATAEMIATDAIVAEDEARAARQSVDRFLARDDVRQQLEALGVDPAEARARAETMSDAEAVELAERIDEVPAGQGIIGPLVGAAVFVFVVLLITDILGFTDVFGFTNKGSANPS